MPELPKDEVSRIVQASGLTHGAIAAQLSAALGRTIKPYVIGRIINGERAVAADEMDAMRRLSPLDGIGETTQRVVPQLTEHSDAVPLYGAAGKAGARLRLSEEFRVGVSPIHPAQRGFRSAFSFIQPDDSLGDLLRKGHIGHVVRDLPPIPGIPCFIELENGDAIARVYLREDANTLFVEVLKPKRAEERLAWRDVKAVHRIVGVTFGSA